MPDDGATKRRSKPFATIAANPDFAEAYRGLGNALLALRCDDEAVVALESAVPLRSDDADAHISLGSALSAQRQMGDAAAYRRANADSSRTIQIIFAISAPPISSSTPLPTTAVPAAVTRCGAGCR